MTALLFALSLLAAPANAQSCEPGDGTVAADIGEAVDRASEAASPATARDRARAQAALSARQAELAEIIEQIEGDEIPLAAVKKLAKWSTALEMTAHETKLSDLLISTGEGAATGTVTNVLVTGTAGFSLATTSVGAAVAAYVSVVKDGFKNIVEIEKAIANSKLHDWLWDYHKAGVARTPDAKLMAFVENAPGFLHTASGERPPPPRTKTFLGIDWIRPDSRDPAEVRDYLKRNATSIYLYIGLLEEVHGPKAFPRYKFDGGEVGDYRSVLKPKLQRELQAIQRDLQAIQRQIR